ncbi:rhodanese-like domain-containing protein [Aquimarina brevivitae]|uniref:Rhodanese-related sulfurtransferase n=1 Tax=Aquimarina brevivitae TaxID=323412 RepID=A0A4Q7PGX8_9FLAO|nr:rhodanese-like domain-containing protein [Aquimarina brevivitae]RZS99776.1 rhodanese-related sulfurtransferase [Aquimarina brevivitae]
MKTYLLFLVLLAQFNYGQDALSDLLKRYNKESVPYITVDQLQEKQDAMIILDSREPNEYKTSHIKNAVYVGYRDFSTENLKRLNIPKDATLVVYCSLGIRSENVAEKIQQLGYKNVFNLYGGIFEWKNKNCPVVNGLNKPTDSIHTYSKKWSKWLHNGIKVY